MEKEWTPEDVKDFRQRLGLFQTQLGELLGVTGRYVSMLEGGERKAGPTLKRLLDCLEEKHSRKRKRKGGKGNYAQET